MKPMKMTGVVGARGLSSVYMVFVFIALVAMVSLGVEVGRVQMVRLQLQTAADAAARAGASGIPLSSTVASDRATAFAAANYADGASVEVDPDQDLEFGFWDSGARSFDASVASSEVNAVRVKAYRTEARENATPLIFARMIGKDFANVSVEAIATVSPGTKKYGIVGLDFINLHGNDANTDSYNSSFGPYGGSNVFDRGDIASNGDISVQNGDVNGGAHPGVEQEIIFGPNGFASGDTSDLDVPLNYPPASAGSAVTTNNNSLIPPQYMKNGALDMKGTDTFTLPGGIPGNPNIYYLTGINIAGNATLTITGPVRIYVNGPIDVAGTMDNVSDKPADLEIRVVSSSAVSFQGNGELFADIYCPQSHVTLGGGGEIFGAVIGRSITMNGQGADIHYDESLDSPPQGIKITLVR